MPRIDARRCGVALATVLALAAGCETPEPTGDAEPATPVVRSFRLRPGAELEKDLAPGEVHRYLIALAAGEYLHLAVEQRGVDLELALFSPDGRKRVVVDSPNGTRGEEHLWTLAGAAGEHHLELHPKAGAGSYLLRHHAQRPPMPADRDRVEAARALAEGDRLRLAGEEQSWRQAVDRYEEALALWRRLEDPVREAVTLVRSGLTWGRLGDREREIRSYELALRALRDQGLASQEIYALLRLGAARRHNAEPSAALAALEEALRLAREIEERSEEATALNDMAILFDLEGRMQQSLKLYREVLAVYREAGRRDWTATVLSNMGFSHILIGQLREAREVLEEALELHRQEGNAAGMARALTHLGWIDYWEGDLSAALRRYSRALELSRAVRDQEQEAGILDRQGTALVKRGDVAEALESYRRARELFLMLRNSAAVAHVEANLGWLHLRRGDAARAGEFLASSLSGFRQSGDRHGEASTLYLGAHVARRRGRLTEARRYVEQVLAIVESHRSASTDEAVRMTYLGSRYEYYEFYVDLLMELDAQQPAAGYGEEAVAAVERSRARSLLDQLTAAATDLRDEVGEPRGRALGLRQIQRQLLDDGSLLLVYSLGRERSFVWAITAASMSAHLLPPADEIETLATRLHESLSRSREPIARMQAELRAAELSDKVLRPVAAELGRRRLVVMADGALHLVPFAALPDPAASGEKAPLIVAHEVVHVPSASVVAMLRREAAGRAATSGVAVVADPVFTPADPRVTGSGSAPAAAGTAGFPDLERLAWSRLEAEAIRAQVPAGAPFLQALDFAARRELVTGGTLRGYRILHFATHGLLHAENPQLTGIVLSRVDEHGRTIDGTLRVAEIYQLDLPAELVVLSACRTALGQRFRGEGVVGLPRAFMYAGAPRVVVSLWNVSDEGTAELMRRFYRGVLGQGMRPAAALRQAQKAMLADQRWGAGYYWAAFVLQGDWR